MTRALVQSSNPADWVWAFLTRLWSGHGHGHRGERSTSGPGSELEVVFWVQASPGMSPPFSSLLCLPHPGSGTWWAEEQKPVLSTEGGLECSGGVSRPETSEPGECTCWGLGLFCNQSDEFEQVTGIFGTSFLNTVLLLYSVLINS